MELPVNRHRGVSDGANEVVDISVSCEKDSITNPLLRYRGYLLEKLEITSRLSHEARLMPAGKNAVADGIGPQENIASNLQTLVKRGGESWTQVAVVASSLRRSYNPNFPQSTRDDRMCGGDAMECRYSRCQKRSVWLCETLLMYE